MKKSDKLLNTCIWQLRFAIFWAFAFLLSITVVAFSPWRVAVPEKIIFNIYVSLTLLILGTMLAITGVSCGPNNYNSNKALFWMTRVFTGSDKLKLSDFVIWQGWWVRVLGILLILAGLIIRVSFNYS